MRSNQRPITRRSALRQAGAAGVSALAWSMLGHAPATAQGANQGTYPAQAPPPPGSAAPTFQYREIVEQGHMIFGRASTDIASAVEYTFASQGEPTAYIVGEEAGGAFIGGLRYGEGEIRLKSGGFSKVFWQGLSIGFDIGGDGSRLIMLAYGISHQQQIFDVFAGPSGIAYVAGGLGVSFHKSDQGPSLAVIRAGVGLRFGVNLEYIRFTSEPTWNPF